MSHVRSSRTGRIRRPLVFLFFAIVVIPGLITPGALAQISTVTGLGDSIGESVQSADATYQTQGFSYHHLITLQLNVSFPLPFIQSGPLGVVGDTTFRSRLSPTTASANLSVSGADVHSLLNDRADAMTVGEIDTETDLVLFPRLGSQMEIAEAVQPDLAVCWIGNNDALAAAITFDKLDASQLTPIPAFEADFQEIAQRLTAAAGKVIFANIPDVTDIAFLVDRGYLLDFLGNDYGLPEGHYTSVVTMFLIQLGLDNGSLIQNPDFVLDAVEVQTIQDRIQAFNTIIQDTADGLGVPVVDMNGLFKFFKNTPPVIFGIPLTGDYLGGLFSLDGVHPANFAQLMIAQAIIQELNAHYSLNIPSFDLLSLFIVFFTDPFIDKDGDGRVTGRFGEGFLETLAPFLGISGDLNDLVPGDSGDGGGPDPGRRFIERYIALRGMDPRMADDWSLGDSIEAFRHLFGLEALAGK